MNKIIQRYKTILAVISLLVPLLSGSASALWWAYENVVFKSDLTAVQTDLSRDILFNQREMLRLRLAQVKTDIAIYEAAINNIIDVGPDQTDNDKRNLVIFRDSLDRSKDEFKEINRNINGLDRILGPTLAGS